jgi:hypothetical protein
VRPARPDSTIRSTTNYLRTFGTALLLSVISAGIQLSQNPEFSRKLPGAVLGAAVGQQFGSAVIGVDPSQA